MPHLVPKIYIKKPAWLARSGAYFKSCARYRTEQGIRYNYKLYNKEGQQVKCQATGPRKLLSFNFPTKGPDGKRHRFDIHRLWAFNSPVLNPGLGRNWSKYTEVHHKPHPRGCPWSNCTTGNLELLSRAEHREWHRHPDNQDVPWCCNRHG